MRRPAPVSSLVAALRRRHADHRLAKVAADPASATVGDVGLLLEAHGVPLGDSRFATARATQLDLDPATLWEWALAFDCDELVTLLRSEMPLYLVRAALEDGLVIHREFGSPVLD